jgi:CBS domain-containing protein
MGPGKEIRRRHQLRIRTRETVEPGPASATRHWVHCPRRDGSVTTSECLVCPSCGGIEVDELGRHLVCELDESMIASADPPRRARRPTNGDRTPLSAVMSGGLVCVSPDLPVESLVTLLVDRGFSGVPVVDSAGKPIGVVSKSDLLEGTRSGTVQDIMMPIAFTLPESASLSHAAALMAYENIHRVPVIAADGAVVGIVTSMDIVRWVAEQDGYVVGRTP